VSAQPHRYRGQCFLCQRDLVLTLATDSTGGAVYRCPRCGGLNSVTRVQANRDIHGSTWNEYGPVDEVEEF
jgi:hypothetical protein